MRRTLLIKRDFQIRIILIVMLTVFIFANTSLALFYYFLSGQLNYFYELVGPVADEKVYGVIIPSIAIIEIVGLIVIFYLSLYISHRMAGPVYRLEKLCGMMREGDFSFRVKVRDNDEFQDLASRLDEMCDSVRTAVGKIREAHADLAAARERLARLIEGGAKADPAVKSEITELSGLIDSLEAKIKFFSTEKKDAVAASDDDGGEDAERSEEPVAPAEKSA